MRFYIIDICFVYLLICVSLLSCCHYLFTPLTVTLPVMMSFSLIGVTVEILCSHEHLLSCCYANHKLFSICLHYYYYYDDYDYYYYLLLLLSLFIYTIDRCIVSYGCFYTPLVGVIMCSHEHLCVVANLYANHKLFSVCLPVIYFAASGYCNLLR